MSCQRLSRHGTGPAGRGILTGAAVAGVLALATACGVPLPHVAIDARPAAARESIQPAAGEGSLGSLRLKVRLHKPRGSAGGGGSNGFAGSVLFGGNEGLSQQTSALGRRLAIVRVYYHIGETFPTFTDGQHMADGSTLLVSLDSDGPSYSSIAAGRSDTTIRAFLRAVNRAAFQYHLNSVYVSFEHEPGSPQHIGLGSPAEFVRAWDHVHQLAAAAHVDWNDGGRLHWVLILMHSTYAAGQADSYWPGAGEVDIVAADGYNSFGCGHEWQKQVPTPAELFNPLLAFARARGDLPAFIAEWGSDNATPGAQPQFIREMQAYVSANNAIAATMYWDDGGSSCNYRVDGRPASLAALATMGHLPLMQGSVSGA
jgi:hypothetical protein